MKPLRICFVCHEYPPRRHGGIGKFVCNLSRYLVRSGHEVRVAGVYVGQRGEETENDEGVQVFRLPSIRVRGVGWILNRYRLYRKVAGWCRRGEIDLVEVPDWQGWAAGWPRLPVPVITRLHGSASYFDAEAGRRLSRQAFWLERASLHRSDFWTSVSRYTAEKTRRLFGLKHGPDAVIFPPASDRVPSDSTGRSRNLVVFTGTLTPKKGVVSLVRAWPGVLARRPDAELHMLGNDGRTDSGESMQAFLQRQLDAQALPSLRFHGFVPDQELHTMLARARVAVFPSYAEAFGMAPVEAMIDGCPTISSQLTAAGEAIQHDTHGLLIDPGDPTQITSAILRVLDDDALAQRLSRAGRERATQVFSIGLIAAENERFYRSCLERFQQARGRPARGDQ